MALLPASADQMPDYVSRDGNVKWCRLKGVTKGHYFTAFEHEVHCIPKAGFTDPDLLARQLWCLTSADNGEGQWYTITNKYDGRQIDVGLSAKFNRWESLQMADKAETRFRFRVETATNDTISLESEIPAPGGGAIFVWVNVYNDEASNYLVWLAREEFSHSTDGQIVIEPADDIAFPTPQSPALVKYYNILSAKQGAEGETVIDNTSVVDTKYKFAIGDAATAGEAAQWRFVETVPGQSAIVNRATGNSISNRLRADGEYNLPEADAKTTMPATWQLNPVTADEFSISTLNTDGRRRYINNTTVGNSPDALDKGNIPGSAFSWKFVEAASATGIGKVQTETLQVRVVDGRVFVDGAENFTITATDGVRMPKGKKLPKGIYIVTADGHTAKVNVK